MLVIDLPAIDLPTPSGPMRTHLFRPPGDGRLPAVVLFTEIFQLTGAMRRTATWLAGQGFLVAVPEIWHEFEPPGTVLGYDPDSSQRGNAHKTAKPMAAFDADTRAVLDFLARAEAGARADAVMTLGFCVGGHLALRAAFDPRVRCAACVYATDLHSGSPGSERAADTLDRLAEIRGQVLCLWGRQDPHIPGEGRALIHRRLTEAGTSFTWHEFDAAHAFMRDEGPRFNPALARIGEDLVLERFSRCLRDA
jgi:carboxymethylenebutenolidase